MIPHSCPTIGDQEIEAAERVLRSGHLAQGSEVEACEEECAALVGRKYAVAVSSGTAALHLALLGMGCDSNSSIALPTYSCASLLQAVGMVGSSAVLCDSTRDGNLDASTLTTAPDGGIVAHMFGGRADVPNTQTYVEDIAQSIGGPTGRATRVAVASFYATKLLTSGEGGMVLTDDADIAAFVRDRRDCDNRDDFVQRFPYKMTDLQAAVGRVQLQKLPGFIETRREAAARYDEFFEPLGMAPEKVEGHVYFRYVIHSESREELVAHLAGDRIEAKRPVHLPMHRSFTDGAPGWITGSSEYPIADMLHEQAVSLPIYPSILEESRLDRVLDSLRGSFLGDS